MGETEKMTAITLGEFEVSAIGDRKHCLKDGCNRKLSRKNVTGYCVKHYQKIVAQKNVTFLVKKARLSSSKNSTHVGDLHD